MVTKYISSTIDGTGDWECDGTDDQSTINAAFTYAYEYGTAASPVTIYMKGPFTYGLSGRLFMGSNTVWTGDSTVCVRVQDYACGNSIPYGEEGAYCVYPDGSPVISQIVGTIPSNIEIHGFELDGNCQNQYTTLGVVHPGTASEKIASSGSGVERLIGFYAASTGTQITNLKIHNMYTHDCFGESLIVRYGQNIQYYNNRASNHQHEGIYYIGVVGTGNVINDNSVEGITSDCIRCSNCQNVEIARNYLTTYYGPNNNGAMLHGQNGMQICNESNKYIETDNINIYGNSILDQGLAGIWLNDTLKTAGSTPQRVWIHDNTFYLNGWYCATSYACGLSVYPWGNGLTIENNSFDANYQEGINILGTINDDYTYTMDIKNNSITNTKDKRAGSASTLAVRGYGIYNELASSLFDVHLQGNTYSSNLNGDTSGIFTVINGEVIKINSTLGMYASNPSFFVIPYTDETEIIAGDQGVMFPTADGHYTFQRFLYPTVGQKALIYPAHASGTYYLLRLAESVTNGQKVVIVPDKKGKYYCVESRGTTFTIPDTKPDDNETPDDGNDIPDDDNETHEIVRVDLRPYCSPVEYQDIGDSCAAHAVIGGYELIMNKTTGSYVDLSRLFAFYNARSLIGKQDEDFGTTIEDEINGIQQWGVCPEIYWPYLEENVLPKPSDEAYSEALAYKISSYWKLQNLDEMRQCLDAGYPFTISVTIYDSFYHGENGTVPYPDIENEVCYGAHAMVVVGYDNELNCFIVRNSWGTGFYIEGYCYMPYEYILAPNLTSEQFTFRL